MKKKAISVFLSLLLAVGLLPSVAFGNVSANAEATYTLEFDACQAPLGICARVGGAGYSYESRSQTTAQAGDVLYVYVVVGEYNINGVDYSCDSGQTWQPLNEVRNNWGMIDGSKKEIAVYSFEMPESNVRIRGNITAYATVSVQQAEHGQIALSQTTGKTGTAALITATPDNGYFLSSLVCVAPDGQETDILNTMSVVFPSSGALTVRALFKNLSNNADVEIASAQEYISFLRRVNAGETFAGKIVRLTEDIDISDYPNTIVGDKFSNPFMGQFDGAGHTLAGVTLTGSFNGNEGDKLYAAPFGCIKSGASINNLCVQGTIAFDITSASAQTSSYVCAGIVADAISSNVTQCTSKVKITLSSDTYTTLRAAGIVASASNSVVNACSNKASITLTATGTVKDGSIGAGIVANALGTTITKCLNAAKVKGFTTSAGIAGCMVGNTSSAVSLCANKANISAESLGQGKAMAAGIVADVDISAVSIRDCYNTADISAGDVANEKQGGVAVVAGIAGYDAQVTCTLENCYNTGSVKRVGTNEDALYRIGDIAPLINIVGTDYDGFNEENAAATITNCYGSSDTFSAANLGSNWREDINTEGSPLLTWEPADATNMKLPVPATSVTLSNTSLALEQYDVATLSATVEPEDTTDALVWSTSNDAVATVSNRGVVTAVGAGTCTITATAGNVSATCEVSVAVCEDTPLHGGETLQQGGTYKLAGDAKGTVTIDTEDAVTIRGMGADKNRKYQNSIYFDCTRQTSKLTLCDMYLSNTGNTNLVNFAGQGNELSIEGTCVLDYSESSYNSGGDALVHVPQDASLTVTGSGTLYAYKSSAGALFGGDGKELNGNITFALTGSMFAKGTKQGAVIGSGAESASVESAPGSITFESGTYNLISNSRGAVIGGAAGSNGASSGTKVYVHGGSINVNCDYSGSAVGGGGYADGNDSSGGTVYITGGSFRTYVDKNAAENITGKYYKGLPLVEGINNVAVTAERKNDQSEDVFLCVVDTQGIEPDADGTYTVTVDGKPFFSGKLHEYAFLNEAIDRADGSGGKVDTSVSYTPENWVANEDSCLYLYLTGTAHTIDVNGQTIEVVYNASSLGTAAETNGGSFTAPYARGDVNNNGSLNIVDAQITYDLVAGVYANEQGDYATFPLPKGWNVATLLLAADANESGTLEAADAFAIQYAVLHNGVFGDKE